MNTQACQYIRIRHSMTNEQDHEQFQERLKSSPIKDNRHYLGLLLMTIVSSPLPRVQYIRTLVKYGVDLNFSQPSSIQGSDSLGKSVLMIACGKSVAQNVKYLLEFENLQVGSPDSEGRTALDYTLMNPNQDEAIQMIEMIVKQFPHLITQTKKCFLFEAIEQNKIRIVELLLMKFIDPNQKFEPIGLTALHYTISLSGQMNEKSLKEILLVLLKFSANPKQKNHFGEDSYDYADKYLFSLETIVESIDYLSIKGTQQKNYKSNTMITHADSRTVFSKDQDDFMMEQANFQEFQKEFRGLCLEESFKLAFQEDNERQFEIINQKDRNNQVNKQEKLSEQVESDGQKQEGSKDQQQIRQKQKEMMEDYGDGIQKVFDFNEKFSCQIWQYYLSCNRKYEEAWQGISCLWQCFQRLAQFYGLSLDLIGSFATGLWTHYSDIDIVFINEEEGYVDINMLLQKIYVDLLGQLKKYGIDEIYLNAYTKYPNIKMKVLDGKLERRIEIAIFQRKCSGRKYVQFIKESINMYPLLPAVYFSFHRVLQNFDLHKPTKRGIKSYTLFLMVLVSMQMMPMSTLSESFQALISFYQYYDFGYEITQKGVRRILNVMDPLNHQNNTGGRETDTQKLIIVFDVVGCALRQAIFENEPQHLLETIFELHEMF